MGLLDRFEPTLLGFFQLENLVGSQVAFIFFDLRSSGWSSGRSSKSAELPPEVSRLLELAKKVDSKQLLAEIETLAPDKLAPVVLICENGRRSSKVAKKLGKMEYLNVCVVNKGVKGLGAEGSSSS